MSEELPELPEGWATTTIREIANYVQRGKSPKYTDWSELPVVNQKSVRWHEIDPKHLKFIHPDQWSQWGEERFLREGDILWNSTGTGTIGRAAIFTGLAGYSRVVADSHVTVVRAKIYNSKLLHFWIMSPVIQGKIASMHVGSTNQVELSRSEVLKTKVPLLPLNEQRRIVAKIEALRARSQWAKEALEAIPPLLEQFRQSVLAAAFRGDLTADWREQNPDVEPTSVLLERIQEEIELVNQNKKNSRNKNEVRFPDQDFIDANLEDLPKAWELTQIRRICSSSFYGPRFGKDEYVTNGIPSIRTTDMTEDGEIILQDPPKLNIAKDKLEDFRVLPRDLLVTRSGSIGIMAVFKGNYVAIPSAYLIRFRFSPKVSVEYIFYYLKSPIGQSLLGLNSTAVTQSNINAEAIKDLPIPIPSLDEQQEIVYRVQSLLKTTAQFKQQYQQAEAYLDQLDQSILAKAFRGELVPQDPNDEPASVLLECIRAERVKKEEAKVAKARGNRGRQRAETSADQFEQINLPGLE